ncbi:MAG: TraR/DksA family transcriptional regulator [Caldilineae bacterium]|nr:MAG: TraR/DksA family transcriptional regulator [Caldilineae bacterium]
MQTQIARQTIQQLEAEKRQVEADIARFEAQLRDRIDPNPEEADPGITSQTVVMALLRNARRKMDAIEQALRQARNGGYGICEGCGQPINPERLKIFPQATLCVPCKSRQERNGRYRAA